MTMTDPIADLITRIRNAQRVGKATTTCLFSKLGLNVLEVLKDEGYIRAYKVQPVREGISEIIVDLKYFEGAPAINTIKKVSKPGRRTYSSIGKVPRVYNGLGISILSTSKGVVSDARAKDLNVGGEVLCQVF